VEAFSADTCSDGEPSAPLSENPTQKAYCSPDRMTAYSRLSRFGMTFAPLTDDRGEALLMSYRAGFHARTSAPQERAQASTAHDPASGLKWHASLAKFDPATSSWRTVQPSLLVDLGESSVIWPRSGMTAGGRCWELPMLTRRTSGNESGLWPTPTVCGNYNRKGESATSGDGLATAVKMWPTPQASDNRNRGTATTPAIARRIEAGKQVMLSMMQDGPLNPTWVEWLMGFPLGWSDCRPLAMPKFREWQQQHGES
jgi:hypothetical protein